MALLWAAGILWFAYDFAGSASAGQNASINAPDVTDASGSPVTSEDANRLAEELGNF